MSYLIERAVFALLLFMFCNVVNAQQTMFRLNCHGTAIFIGHDGRCATGILQIGIKETVTRCYQWCISVDKCRGANMKEGTQDKVKCELIEGSLTSSTKCKLLDEAGWQYFEAVLTYPSVVLDEGFFNARRNSGRTIEEKLNPEIYIPFSKLYCGKAILYGRGHDQDGKNAATIDGTYTEINMELSSTVMMVLKPKRHEIGNFGKHPMNKPRGHHLSVSMWIKVSSFQKNRGDSFYFGCGDINDDGFYIRHTSYGKSIAAGFTDSFNNTRYYLLVTTAEKFGDWKHLVLTIKGTSSGNPVIALYVNGTSIAGDQYVERLMFNPIPHPHLGVGSLAGFSRFAYWNRVLSPEEITAIYKRK